MKDETLGSVPVLSSDGVTVYRVTVYRDAVGILRAQCECKGWHFRKTCRHATAILADWESEWSWS